MSETVGVVLLNLGGPDTLDAVEPFLYNLFSDPDIIDFPGSFLFRKRLAKLISSRRHVWVQKQYAEIGGGSPLKAYTLKQAELLEKRLNKTLPVRVYVAMRYWEPFTDEALDQIERDGVKRVVLLPLYPHFSKATTESSKKEWDQRLNERKHLELETTLIESYYDHPIYVDALIERIHEGLDRFPADRRDDVHLVFSAHGTPMKLVRQGDPYSGHIKKTVEAVMGRVGVENAHSLCYQSKVGPLKWLEPSTPDMIKDLAGKGVKDMLLIPVAFASDHLETLFELGIEYRRVAKEVGVEQYEVTTGLNDSPKFIEALSELVLTHFGRETEQQASGAAN